MKKILILVPLFFLYSCTSVPSVGEINKIKINDSAEVLKQTLGEPNETLTDNEELEENIEVAIMVLDSLTDAITDDNGEYIDNSQQHVGLAYALTLMSSGDHIQALGYKYKDEDGDKKERFYVINYSENENKIISYYDD